MCSVGAGVGVVILWGGDGQARRARARACTYVRTRAEGHPGRGEEEVVGRPVVEGVAVDQGQEHEHGHALAQPDEGLVVAVSLSSSDTWAYQQLCGEVDGCASSRSAIFGRATTHVQPIPSATHAPERVGGPVEDALGVVEEHGALPHQVREGEAEDDGQRQQRRDAPAPPAPAAGALRLVTIFWCGLVVGVNLLADSSRCLGAASVHARDQPTGR